jgi:hypothetical protein
VQDAHDLKVPKPNPIENRVRGDKRRSQPWLQLSSKPPRQRICSDRLTDPLVLPQNIVGYVGRRDACLIPPNADQVLFCPRAHTTRLARAMLDAGLRNHFFDIKRLTLPGIELADPDFDFSSPPAESVQAFEELTAEQLLHRLQKLTSLRHRDFERLHQKRNIAERDSVDEFRVRRAHRRRRTRRLMGWARSTRSPVAAAPAVQRLDCARRVDACLPMGDQRISVERIQRNTACASPAITGRKSRGGRTTPTTAVFAIIS